MQSNVDAAILQRAREICASHDPDKGYQYLEGQRDDYMPMTAVISALSSARYDAVEALAAGTSPAEPVVTCSSCAGSGFENPQAHTRICEICGGQGAIFTITLPPAPEQGQ